MAWEIVLLEPVESWFLKLCESDPESATLIEKAIDRLAESGPALGRPLVDTLMDSDMSNLKELRPGSRKRTEIDIVFVFDPDREAIFLAAETRPADGHARTRRRSHWPKHATPSTAPRSRLRRRGRTSDEPRTQLA